MACNVLDQRRHLGGNQLNLFPAAFNGLQAGKQTLGLGFKGFSRKYWWLGLQVTATRKYAAWLGFSQLESGNLGWQEIQVDGNDGWSPIQVSNGFLLDLVMAKQWPSGSQVVAKYCGQVWFPATLFQYTLIHVGHSTIQKDDICINPLLSMTENILIDGERLFPNKFCS